MIAFNFKYLVENILLFNVLKIENCASNIVLRLTTNHFLIIISYRVRIKVFNAIFQQYVSYVVVEETRVPPENHRPVASHRQTLSHNVVSSTPHHEWDLNSQL